MIKINISKDFSETPGGRFIKESKYSGELFRKEQLLPKYEEAVQKQEKLVIELDGCFGYPSSFIDEAFGGLARIKLNENILSVIEFISEDQPSLIDDIRKCVVK